MKSLDIHGRITSEAEVLVRNFIKECYITRSGHAVIIHGNGKYILQQKTHEILRNSKYVKDFEYAPPQFGGTGATIFNLNPRGIRKK